MAVQRKDAGEGFPLRALRVSAVKWAARKEPPPANDLRPPAAFGFPAPPGCAFSRLLPGSRCSPAATRFPSPPLEERAGERREVGLKSEARSPRAERRPSSEIRRPKPEVRGRFGLRPSGFDLLSAFDLRASDLTRCSPYYQWRYPMEGLLIVATEAGQEARLLKVSLRAVALPRRR